MTEPRPSVSRFVEAILRAEVARGGGAGQGDASERIVARLRSELGRVIGFAGFDVLLARSLVLARRTDPTLAGVVVGPRGALVGLGDAKREGLVTPHGALKIVGQFVELLIVLIGEDLAMRLVGDVWPMVQAEEEDK